MSRRSWRPPLLAFAALQCGLHAINHWVDVDNASRGSGVGLFDAISLTVLTAVIAALWRAAATAPTREALHEVFVAGAFDTERVREAVVGAELGLAPRFPRWREGVEAAFAAAPERAATAA